MVKLYPDTTVSIVTHGSPVDELRRAAECVLRSPRVGRLEILDNSGTDLPDRYEECLSEYGEHIRIRRIPNDGYGAGHNVALRESLDDDVTYHLVMNADVYWDGDVISRLCDVMDRRPEIGQIMPKVYYPDGALQLTARRLPTPLDLFAKRFLPSSFTRRRIGRYLLERANHDVEINCPYLLGSFMLLRTDALRDAGIFDERFFMYPEDIDLTRRIHRKYKTLHYPGVNIIHAHAAASRKSLRMLRIHVVNMIRYFNKWGWLRDRERREMNKALEAGIELLPLSAIPPSRG